MPNRSVDNIRIENAQLLFRNFSGRSSKYNRAGDKNFCVIIENENDAQRLIEEGWTLRILRPRDEDERPRYYMQVKVKFSPDSPSRDPKIIMHTKNTATRLDEETVSTLDFAEIINADISIRPYPYDVDGRQGLSAYLKTLHVTIEEDEFADKYAYSDDSEMPF